MLFVTDCLPAADSPCPAMGHSEVVRLLAASLKQFASLPATCLVGWHVSPAALAAWAAFGCWRRTAAFPSKVQRPCAATTWHSSSQGTCPNSCRVRRAAGPDDEPSPVATVCPSTESGDNSEACLVKFGSPLYSFLLRFAVCIGS